MQRDIHLPEHLHAISISGKCHDELKEISSWYENNTPKRDLLATFNAYETIDNAVDIDHLIDGTDSLVYHDGHENEKEEAEFDVIGIIGEANFPTSHNLNRFSRRPFSFIQQAKIIGGDCKQFNDSMDAINTFHTYFDQNTSDSNFMAFRPTSCNGIDSISANNPLISLAASSMRDEQCQVPKSMDPEGIVSTFLSRDAAYVFTWDNEVEYLTMKKSGDKKIRFKKATPINPGFFREGHIVRLTMNIRSGVIKDGGRNQRRLLPIIRKVTLMSRCGAIMIAKLRAERLAQRVVIPNNTMDGPVQRTRPPKRRRSSPESDDDDTPLKIARMTMNDRSSVSNE